MDHNDDNGDDDDDEMTMTIWRRLYSDEQL